jgi:UDPglucose--hexose-1-phosphate uridylyltransferase
MTPQETLAYRESGTGGWRVRAFANRFPALTSQGSTQRRNNGLFLGMDGIGAHEVIVESRQHNKFLALMDNGEVADVLHAYQERYQALNRLSHVALIIIFKNHGPRAGTSLEHPHSQIVATPVVPRHIRTQYEIASHHYDNTGRCLLAELVDRELKDGRRIIMETEYFVAFHPFASHHAFETWICPRDSRASFGNTTERGRRELARVLRLSLLKLYRGLNNPDFNYVIDSAPGGHEIDKYYRWHLRIVPRLTEIAGFEIGSGIHINSALPEETAAFIRELKVE